MGDLEVKKWLVTFGGRQSVQRERVACSKIGDVLKTYSRKLLRAGENGLDLEEAELSEMVARLLVEPAVLSLDLNDGSEDDGVDDGYESDTSAATDTEDAEEATSGEDQANHRPRVR